jgi:nucleoid-associated protein YgaU
MGLFKFMSDVGESLFGSSDKEKAEVILKAIASKNLDIQNLTVSKHGDKVSLEGTAKTSKDAEIALLVAGNHKGVAEVESARLVVETPAATRQGASAVTESMSSPAQLNFVHVQAGDTLSKIAAKHLGSASRYNELFEANRPMLSHPDKIYPGQTLRIPDAHV